MVKIGQEYFKELPVGIAKAIEKSPLIIGIGPSAWPRIISAFYFPRFKILCYSDCQDNEFIKNAGVEVYSLKHEDPTLEIPQITPGKILDTPLSKAFLAKQEKPFVFLVYKSLGSLEKACRENNWHYLGNPKELRDHNEDKRIFKEVIREIGLEAIPGENIPLKELTKEKFIEYQKKLGQTKLVLQIAEATWGGGCGTLFIDDVNKLQLFFDHVKELNVALEGKKKKLLSVNIAPFIEGESVSLPCCTTRYGVLTGSIQSQIIDIPEVGTEIKGRSGNFAGHDWTLKHYNTDIQNQASKIAQRFGDYLYKKGFKGIFGLDLIVDKKDKVWPVECNPRETDAFPLICMLQMEKGAVPMQVFHNLEHLGVDYSFDFEEVDKSYKEHFNAGQIILYNKLDKYIVDRQVFKAGIYEVSEGKLNWLRPGFLFSDLKNEHEFLFTEDISKEAGNTYEPHERMLRLIKRGGILEDRKLKKEVAEVVELTYKELKLVPIEHGLVGDHGLNILFTDKLVSAKTDAERSCADIVNVVRKTPGGIRRPISIAWRKTLTKSLIIDQITSKRAKKQIKSDLQKIGGMGIEIKTVPEIDEPIFADWLALYTKIISAKEMGDVLIGKNWLAEKKQKGKKVGAVLAYQNGKLIGGELFFEVSGRLCEGYGVNERVDGLAGGLTLLMDYYFLEHAHKQNYTEVSFGQDTNLYGFDLSAGLISYKVKLGFTPVPAAKTYFVNTFFLNFDKFEDKIMFFSQEGEGLILTIVSKNPVDESEIYLPQGIEKYKVYNSAELIEEHRKFLISV